MENDTSMKSAPAPLPEYAEVAKPTMASSFTEFVRLAYILLIGVNTLFWIAGWGLTNDHDVKLLLYGIVVDAVLVQAVVVAEQKSAPFRVLRLWLPFIFLLIVAFMKPSL